MVSPSVWSSIVPVLVSWISPEAPVTLTPSAPPMLRVPGDVTPFVSARVAERLKQRFAALR